MAELQEHFKLGGWPPQDERLLSNKSFRRIKRVVCNPYGLDEKGQPILRLHKRFYLKRY
jgi:hypothetical protein